MSDHDKDKSITDDLLSMKNMPEPGDDYKDDLGWLTFLAYRAGFTVTHITTANVWEQIGYLRAQIVHIIKELGKIKTSSVSEKIEKERNQEPLRKLALLQDQGLPNPVWWALDNAHFTYVDELYFWVKEYGIKTISFSVDGVKRSRKAGMENVIELLENWTPQKFPARLRHTIYKTSGLEMIAGTVVAVEIHPHNKFFVFMRGGMFRIVEAQHHEWREFVGIPLFTDELDFLEEDD